MKTYYLNLLKDLLSYYVDHRKMFLFRVVSFDVLSFSYIISVYVVNITYIPCLYKKDVSRGDFEILQSYYKGAKSKNGVAFWSQVYVYILSMGRGCVCVENIHSFFTLTAPHRWTAISVGAVRDHSARGALSNAIGPTAPASLRLWVDLLIFIVHLISLIV